MNLRKIKSLDNKVRKEVEKAINAIYRKHNTTMINLIREQLGPKETLYCVNGMTQVIVNGKQIESGRAWGINHEGEQHHLAELSCLQYTNEFHGGFTLPDKIKKK